MLVFVQAYSQTEGGAQPVVAYITFYRGQEKAFQTAPLLASEAGSNRLNTIPLRFRFALEKLTPGEYTCQMTVLNPSGQKASFWLAPVMIVP